MGLCPEFGPRLTVGCDHAMEPGHNACSCPECGVVCQGLFEACGGVWAKAVVAKAMNEPAGDDEAPATAPSGVLMNDEMLQWLGDSVVGLTEELRAVVVSVDQQGEETRALLHAQQQATTLLLEAIQQLPRQLEAAADSWIRAEPEEVAEPSRLAEPIELLRPEVVRLDTNVTDASGQNEPPAGRARGGRRA
jgi:hypothetical protein